MSKSIKQTKYGNTLRDISNDSKLSHEEKVALRQIAEKYDKLETEYEWLGEVFLKMEGLAQSGSDMEGHELSYKMCEILHPELYEEVRKRTPRP